MADDRRRVKLSFVGQTFGNHPATPVGELQQLLNVLALGVGNKLDYTKLSQAVGISRPTLAEYLDLLEKTYVIHNQLRNYGELAYLAKGNEYEVDFVLTRPAEQPVGLEVKYHPVSADAKKLKRISEKHGFSGARLVGRYLTPEFDDFLWGGLIF
jgi:predicted AAA+ superfamily ATPase